MPPTPAGRPDAGPEDPLPLIHQGWDHLKRERPLAAWASWQRALRIDPDQPAARQALDLLAYSAELPASARGEYRFRPPTGPDRRSRWDATLQGRDLSDLAEAASAFAGLAADDPADPDAPFNQALCLAWLGRNVEAIEALDRSVGAGAATDFDGAVAAWTLAGILRTGGGAEEAAEVHGYTLDLSDRADPAELLDDLAKRAHLRRLPPPDDVAGIVTVDEWLDRPWPDDETEPLTLDEVPRVVAIVIVSPSVLRLSLPDPVLGPLRIFPGWDEGTWHPLPLARLDAAAWTIRLPTWVDETTRHRLTRETIEDYYENRWINRPLRGLGMLTPLQAASRAVPGDLPLLAKLGATIGLREELAERPSASILYQGYPFDRLRHRLGLSPRDPATVDPLEIGFMTAAELGRLNPDSLDDDALADAHRSAVPLGDEELARRFEPRPVANRSRRRDPDPIPDRGDA